MTMPPYTGLVIFAVFLFAAGVVAYFYYQQQQKKKTVAAAAAAVTLAAAQKNPLRPVVGLPCSKKTEWSMSYNRPAGCVADISNGLSRYRSYAVDRNDMNQKFLAAQM